MRLLIHTLLAFLCLLSMPGCTKVVLDYAGKVEIRDNRVAEITQAWRGEDQEMTICVRGWPAERARDTSPVEFSMTVPLALFGDSGRPSPLLVDGGHRIKMIVIPTERIAEGCPEKPDGATDVITNTVSADYFASVSPRQASDDQIEQFVNPNTAEVGLFAFEAQSEPPSVALVYRHDEPVFDGSRLVWINPGDKSVKPNEPAYLALPLAFATDVVLVVGVIVIFALAAVAGAA